MKLPLTLDEQIEHIKTNKNIIFEEVSEDEAKKFLQIYGYGNIISAYKHHFHNGKNSEGNHIYTKHVDFKRYLEKYDSERDKHKIILTKVLKIENTLNTLVIDTILLDSKGFLSSNPNSKKLDAFLNHWFINILLESSREMKIKGNSSSKFERYITIYSKVKKEAKKTQNIYLALSSISFSDTIELFSSLPQKKQKDIFKVLVREEMNLKTTQPSDYIQILRIIKDFRNCCAHNSSFNFLIIYKKRGSKKKRTEKEKRKYYTIKTKLLKLNL